MDKLAHCLQFVVSRDLLLQEVRVAELQQELRIAALNGDWGLVDELMRRAEQEARDNAWVRASLKPLRRYAREQDRQRMSKEAFYSARKMMQRLAEKDEDTSQYLEAEEAKKAAFLRKKMEQGKRLEG